MIHQTSLEHTIYWLQAILYQGERVLIAENIQGHRNQTITPMEEQFFLNAVNKALRWAKELKSTGCCENEIKVFLSSSSIANLVRNKREHDDEYFGPEKKPEKLSKVPPSGAGNLRMFVGQSITVQRGKKILLGGTVDVHDIMGAAKDLLKPLLEKQHEYWKSRALGNIDNVKHFFAPEKLISK